MLSTRRGRISLARSSGSASWRGLGCCSCLGALGVGVREIRTLFTHRLYIRYHVRACLIQVRIITYQLRRWLGALLSYTFWRYMIFGRQVRPSFWDSILHLKISRFQTNRVEIQSGSYSLKRESPEPSSLHPRSFSLHGGSGLPRLCIWTASNSTPSTAVPERNLM